MSLLAKQEIAVIPLSIAPEQRKQIITGFRNGGVWQDVTVERLHSRLGHVEGVRVSGRMDTDANLRLLFPKLPLGK